MGGFNHVAGVLHLIGSSPGRRHEFTFVSLHTHRGPVILSFLIRDLFEHFQLLSCFSIMCILVLFAVMCESCIAPKS